MQTSRRTFKLAQRLTAARVAALKAFWDGQQGGVVSFLVYNLVEGAGHDPRNNISELCQPIQTSRWKLVRTLRHSHHFGTGFDQGEGPV